VDAAGVAAVAVAGLALVVAAAVVRHRRGGLHLIVRLWWGHRDQEDGDA
jgi:hypothetical protein